MLMYFIIFVIVGVGLGTILKEENKAVPAIIVLAVLWGLGSAPVWGLTSLGEMLLGLYLYVVFIRKNKKDT